MPTSDLAARYLDALNRWDRAALEALLTPDVVQEEMPNRLVPAGGHHDRAAMLAAFERGTKSLTHHRYEIVGVVSEGDTIAIEARWEGTLAVGFGTLAPGDTMRARFAIFLRLRDGKIAHIRNYDCLEPF